MRQVLVVDDSAARHLLVRVTLESANSKLLKRNSARKPFVY